MDIKIKHDFNEIFFLTYKNFDEIKQLCSVENVSIPSHPVSIFTLLPSIEKAINYPYQFIAAGHFTVGENHITERMNRPDYLLILTEKGLAYAHYEGNIYTLTPGSLLFIDCNKYHKYWVAPNNIWEYKHIHFATECPQFLDNHLPIFLESSSQIKMVIDDFFAYLRSVKSPNITSPYIYSKHINDILTKIITTKFFESDNTPSKFEKILKYIRSHCNEEIRIEVLAEQAGYSESHFIRKFKKYYLITPHQYITQCRIANVHKKLLDGSTVNDAAISCGFNSASAFYYSLKKQNVHNNTNIL